MGAPGRVERREAEARDEASTGENIVTILGHLQTKCVVGEGAINKVFTEAVIWDEP